MRELAALEEAIAAGCHCYISDIAFCCKERRDQTVADLMARFPRVPIDYIFFANNLEQCTLNLMDKPNENAARLRDVARFTACYVVPEGHAAIPVAVRVPPVPN